MSMSDVQSKYSPSIVWTNYNQMHCTDNTDPFILYQNDSQTRHTQEIHYQKGINQTDYLFAWNVYLWLDRDDRFSDEINQILLYSARSWSGIDFHTKHFISNRQHHIETLRNRQQIIVQCASHLDQGFMPSAERETNTIWFSLCSKFFFHPIISW